MILKIPRSQVQKAFSRASHQYEDLADLQACLGDELLQRLSDSLVLTLRERSGITKRPWRILDIGTGTARLLPGLQGMFPGSHIVGLDLAFEMLLLARSKIQDVALIQADATCLPFKDNTFDLLVSNASYQWVSDLCQAFRWAYSVLKPGGVFYLAMFGYESLKELFATFEHVGGDCKGEGPRFNRLHKLADIRRSAAWAGFMGIESSLEERTICFKDLRELLRWLKGIGANTLGERRFIGKGVLQQADAYYRDHFSLRDGVGASFEIIWLKAMK